MNEELNPLTNRHKTWLIIDKSGEAKMPQEEYDEETYLASDTWVSQHSMV